MKKFTYFISCIALLVGVVLFVQSCMKTDENKQDTVETEADKFVASPEYQAFLEKSRMNILNRLLIMKQLPDDHYKKYMSLVHLALKTQSDNERASLYKEMSEILGYDIKAENRNMAEEYRKLAANINFSPEEIIRAQTKYRYKLITETKTRVARKKEKDHNKEARNACVQSCMDTRSGEYAECYSAYGGDKYYYDCCDTADFMFDGCVDGCEQQYPYPN